jgi:hypothetical protein
LFGFFDFDASLSGLGRLQAPGFIYPSNDGPRIRQATVYFSDASRKRQFPRTDQTLFDFYRQVSTGLEPRLCQLAEAAAGKSTSRTRSSQRTNLSE